MANFVITTRNEMNTDKQQSHVFAEAFSRLSASLVYLYDFENDKIVADSTIPHSLTSLCDNRTIQDAYEFFDHLLSEDQKEKYQSQQRRFFRKLSKLPPSTAGKATLIYNILIHDKTRQAELTQKATLLRGNLYLCSLSYASQSGHQMKPVIQTPNATFTYDETKDIWQEVQTPLFSDREQQITRLTMQGMTEEDIANHLCLSVCTIKRDKRMLFDKSGVKNMHEAIAFGINHNLL